MRSIHLLNILVLVLVFFSCGSDEINELDQDITEGLKIMPLGASRVEGARPLFESFRYELWKQMVDAEWEFNFIGAMEDQASYPVYKNLNFDNDHEGRGGWTSGQILAGLEGWLQTTGAPDIVLFSTPGGNDALQGLDYDQALRNINSIIDQLQEANPNVSIIVEQPAPGRSSFMTGELLTYFEQLKVDIVGIASSQTTATSKVTTVDMFTGFSDELLADVVHYNEEGARFIADRYFEALKSYFN